MKESILILVALFLTGCVGMSPTTLGPSANSKPLLEIHRIKAGMTMAEVKAILGDKLIIGYDASANDPQKFDAITIPQPYRQEQFSKADQAYVILYYVTSIAKPDGMIAEDELTPLVFEGETLVAKGADELDRLKRQ